MKSDGWQIPRLLVALTRPYLKSRQLVADIGCGPGLVGDELSRYTNWNGTLVGMDIAEKRLREAARKPVYSSCVQANAYKLPFDDRTFDVILSSAMVGLTGPSSIEEMFRILKAGGTFACIVGEVKNIPWCKKRFREAKLRLAKLHGARTLYSLDLGSGYGGDYDGEHYIYYLLRKSRY